MRGLWEIGHSGLNSCGKRRKPSKFALRLKRVMIDSVFVRSKHLFYKDNVNISWAI